MVIDASIIRRTAEADPYLTAKDVAYEHFVALRQVEAIAKICSIDFAMPCATSPYGTTPAPRSHGSSKLPPAPVVKIMLEREPDLTAAEFAKRYGCSPSSAYMIAKNAGVRFAQKKRGPKPKDWLVRALGARIGDVYHFANNVTVTYDHRGKLMPHFTGPTREIWPRLQTAGWRGELEVLDTYCDLKRLRPRKKEADNAAHAPKP